MSKRIVSIDICKGLGMMLVILGHMHMLGSAREWVWTFYMPMFVILSGIVHKECSIYTCMKRILYPYFVLGLAGIVIVDVLTTRYDLSHDFFSLLCGCTWPNYMVVSLSPLWYLSAFFITKSIYVTLDRHIENRWAMLIFVLACGLAGCFLGRIRLSRQFVFNFDIGLIFVPFYHFGRFLGGVLLKHSNTINWKKVCAIAISSMVMSFVLTEINGGYNIATNAIGGNAVLFYAAAIVGSVFMLSVSYFISKVRFLNIIVSSFGRQTLAILLIHYPFAMYFLVKKQQYAFPIWMDIIMFISISILSFGVAVMIEKEIPEVLGK